MNQREKTGLEVVMDDIEELKESQSVVKLACQENSRGVNAANLKLDTVLGNHLPHLKNKIDMIFKWLAIGFASLAVIMSLFGILITAVVR